MHSDILQVPIYLRDLQDSPAEVNNNRMFEHSEFGSSAVTNNWGQRFQSGVTSSLSRQISYSYP